MSVEKIWLQCRFTHPTRKVMGDEIECGLENYRANLPQNGADGVVVAVWRRFAEGPAAGLTFAVENPVSAEGAELAAEAFRLAFIPARGKLTPDPMMPNTGTFSAEESSPAVFFVRVSAGRDAPAGVYTGAVRVERGGEVICRAEYSARVWAFALPDVPVCGTLFGISKAFIAKWHGADEAKADELYKKYYDFLLENKICAYALPYDVLDSRADAYLDDPRVKSFKIPYAKDDETLLAYHKKLSSKPEWFEKGIFYPIDEPTKPENFDRYEEMCRRLDRCFPDFKIITPIYESLMNGEEVDGLTRIAPWQTHWCLRSDRFGSNKTAGYEPEEARAAMVERFGSIRERMERERAGGDKIWWYVCGYPYMKEYCDLNLDSSGASHRVLLWQQFAFGVEGLLYWRVTHWNMEEGTPWTSPFTYDKVRCGDGSLLYNGNEIGVDGPVGSLRLEMVRAGIDDFELLTMAKKLLSKAELDAILNPIVNPSPSLNEAIYGDAGRDIFTFCDSDDAFYEARARLGRALEAALRQNTEEDRT